MHNVNPKATTKIKTGKPDKATKMIFYVTIKNNPKAGRKRRKGNKIDKKNRK